MAYNTLIFDLARVLLFPRDGLYDGTLNSLHKKLSGTESYIVNEYFRLNDELLEYLDSLKSSYSLYIYTSGSIQREPWLSQELTPRFKGIYSAEEMGIPKSDPAAYIKLAKTILQKPNTIIFVDDTPSNVQAAVTSGMRGIEYIDNKRLFTELKTILDHTS